MGYSTHLYAVDVSELKRLCNREAPDVARIVLEASAAREQGERPVDYRKGPKVFVNYKSEISVNETPVSVDAFKTLLVEPRWRGTMLYVHQQHEAPTGKRNEGQFRETGSFAGFLYGLGNWFVENGTTFSEQFCGIEWCNRLEDFAEIEAGLFDVATPELILDILNKKFRYPKMGADYGYAFEWICEIIGQDLGSVGTDRLRSLELKSPLSKTRSPVRLPRREEFPYISYVDRLEAEAELERIQSIAPSPDPEIASERDSYSCCLSTAVSLGLGVVGFYY